MVTESFKNFFKAYWNIYLFLPYFFSVTHNIRTLFYPWKNLVAKKTKPGFDFNETLSVISFNLISRGIGFFIRISTLVIYLITQILFTLSFPFLFLAFLLLFPLMLIKDVLFSENTRRLKLKDRFMKNHLLNPKNKEQVEKWFENFYDTHLKKQKWWSVENLFAIQPIGKDWSYGYTVNLNSISIELTSAEYVNRITEIVDRERELKLLQDFLLKQRGGNILIVGEPGVGKHTLVDALAKLSWKNKLHPALSYKRILKIDLLTALSKYKSHPQRINFLKTLLKEAVEAKNIILVIDRINEFLDPEKPDLNIKPALMEFLNSPYLHVIGLVNTFEWQTILKPQSDLQEAFETLVVTEITKDQALNILLKKFWVYEKKYNIFLPFETLQSVLYHSEKFITDIPFPEKAFKLLEESIIYALSKKKKILTPELIQKYLEEKLNIPFTLTEEIKQKLNKVEEELKKSILSQDNALEEISLALKKSLLNLKDRKKPLASFLFLGPTGVGKTETAKTLARIFFGSENKLERIDLGFYQRKEDLPKLLGDANTKTVGELTAKITKLKYGVLLLDELEKAHKSIFNTLLTLLDEGYIVDYTGKKIDCRYLFVIATSNAGSNLYINNPDLKKEDIINYLIKNEVFSPEFLNRFDDVILFNPLSFDTIFAIAKRKTKKLLDKYKREYKIEFSISDEQLRKELEKSQWKIFGAREIDRVITKKIESQIVEKVLNKK